MSRSPLRGSKIEGPAGPLEVLYQPVEAGRPLRGAAVVCHPHPLYGGTMHTKVVYHLARALGACGLSVLRFNFRGVGLSGGSHDGGPGELEDVRAALDHLAGECPGAPLIAAGHSFGCWAALAVGARDPRVAHLVGVGVPLTMHDFGFLGAARKDILLLQGDRDPFGAVSDVRALGARVGARVEVLAGGGHLLEDWLDELREAVEGHLGAGDGES